MNTVKRNMSLLSLLGLFLPFGNLWGPFLCSCKEEDDRRFRTKLVVLGTINIVLSLGVNAALLLPIFQRIAAGEAQPPTISWALCLYPVLTLFIALGLYLNYRKK